jgi:hypothetical protein
MDEVCMICRLFLAVLAALLVSTSTWAADFRVESKVFADDEKETVSENTTLFHGGKIYDFLATPSEITVYDLPRTRILLLSPSRGVQTEVSVQSLHEFSSKLQEWAASQADPLLKFSARPQFDQQLNESTREASFNSQFVTYRVVSQTAKSEEIARQYREFCDLSGRLNGLVNPGGLPPFPRLEVNRALEESRKLPEEVHLNIASRRFGGKPLTARSEHRFHWRVLEADQERIAETAEYLTRLTKVSIQQYLQTGFEQAQR